MKYVVLGAGVQGSIYAAKLAAAGDDVTLVARGRRGAELRANGVMIEHALSDTRDAVRLPLIERMDGRVSCDVCLVAVRREQLDAILPDLRRAVSVGRVVVMANHANGSQSLLEAVGAHRLVLGFPGFAGGLEDGVVRYVDIPQQPTAIQRSAPDIARAFRRAGIRTALVSDMDAFLQRHAVFVTAIAGALYEWNCDARALAADATSVRSLILAVREGWAGLDRLGTGPAPLGLRSIFSWVPLPLAAAYWRRLLASPQGEYFFARHSRRAAPEMQALANDVRALLGTAGMSHLLSLFGAIDRAAASRHYDLAGAS